MKNICSVCGKPFDYSLSVKILPNGKKTCVHDGVQSQSFFLTQHEKDIQKRLPKNQKVVKGKEGISRIVEV